MNSLKLHPAPSGRALSSAATASLLTILFSLPAAWGAGAALPSPQRARPVQPPVPANLFPLVGPDYKKPQEVPDSFFNPFKVEATTELTQARRGTLATAQTVVEAIGHRGFSGMLYTPGSASARVIIGDQVFHIGEELVFPDATGTLVPLVPGASVTLRQVGAEGLVFDLIPDGESSRRAAFPLRDFWRP